MITSNDKASKDKPFSFVLLAGCIVALILMFFAGSSYFLPDLAKRGQFGDSFGAINALFSGLAFAGLISTLFLQRSELQLQREELSLTRAELAEQSAAQNKQADAALKAAAINSLSALLNLQMKRFDGLTPGVARREQDDKIRAIEQRLENLLREVAP